MTSVPPPSGWEERLLADRAERDTEFREASDTPLLPADLRSFDGLDYWAPDPEYRLVGPLEIYDHPERFEIPTTTGKIRPCERYGRVTFELDGRTLTLQVYRLLDAGNDRGLFLPFTDRTTGVETYPAGRYIDLDGQPGGLYVLDFNAAYNPLCAYGKPEEYVCPVTPRENRLDVRIEAGERGYKKE
jgi:uncharacterized protein (DUF1684 family)